MNTHKHSYILLLSGLLILLSASIQASGKPAYISHKAPYRTIPGTSLRDLFYAPDSYPGHKADDEKSKKISRNIKVQNNDKLIIDNRYGKVHINTWDKNEVTVNIDIIARASTDSRAAEILNMINIDIDEDRGDNVISFTTRIDKANNKNWGNNSKYEINYTVSMPRQNPLQAKNMYGDLYVADLNGNADISLSYGSMKLGKLGGESTVRLAYGSGSNSIAQLKKGSLNISYSKLTLEETDILELKNSYADINIGKAGTINLSSRYGSVDINSITSLEGSSGYSGFSIGSLTDKIDMKLQYCSGFKITDISSKFNSINLEGSYSSLNLTFKDNTAFKFNVNLQYGDLRVDKENVQFNVVEKRNNSNMYQGQFGKSGAGGKVNISSRYGDVRFAHNGN
jgi:hypothetical protein